MEKLLEQVISTLLYSDRVRDQATFFYRVMIEKEQVELTPNSSLLALSVFLAARECREGKRPSTIQKIVNVFQELGHHVTFRSIMRIALEKSVEDW